MKIIKYKYATEVSHGSEENQQRKEVFSFITLGYSEANEELAKREAYNGEYTIEDDGQPEPTPEPTIWDELATAYQEGVNEV